MTCCPQSIIDLSCLRHRRHVCHLSFIRHSSLSVRPFTFTPSSSVCRFVSYSRRIIFTCSPVVVSPPVHLSSSSSSHRCRLSVRLSSLTPTPLTVVIGPLVHTLYAFIHHRQSVCSSVVVSQSVRLPSSVVGPSVCFVSVIVGPSARRFVLPLSSSVRRFACLPFVVVSLSVCSCPSSSLGV